MDALGISWQIRKGSTIEQAGRHLRRIRRKRAEIAVEFARLVRKRENLVDFDACLAEAEEKTKGVIRNSKK